MHVNGETLLGIFCRELLSDVRPGKIVRDLTGYSFPGCTIYKFELMLTRKHFNQQTTVHLFPPREIPIGHLIAIQAVP